MNIVIVCLTQLLSIGLSDAIEFAVNKPVHKYHNCPDIMRMCFKDYGYFDAFLSGLKVSWFLILFEIIILFIIQIICKKNIT